MKKVGNAMYVHRSNVSELSRRIPANDYLALMLLIKKASRRYRFEVVKYEKGNVSLIDSPDWDIENEPTVGDSYRWIAGRFFDTDGQLVPPAVRRYNPENPQIYHMKWMFVDPSYRGFDYEASKRRSVMWNSVIPHTKDVKSRIGYRKYWNEILRRYGLPR